MGLWSQFLEAFSDKDNTTSNAPPGVPELKVKHSVVDGQVRDMGDELKRVQTYAIVRDPALIESQVQYLWGLLRTHCYAESYWPDFSSALLGKFWEALDSWKTSRPDSYQQLFGELTYGYVVSEIRECVSVYSNVSIEVATKLIDRLITDSASRIMGLLDNIRSTFLSDKHLPDGFAKASVIFFESLSRKLSSEWPDKYAEFLATITPKDFLKPSRWRSVDEFETVLFRLWKLPESPVPRTQVIEDLANSYRALYGNQLANVALARQVQQILRQEAARSGQNEQSSVGVAQCPVCGANLEMNARRCPYCATEVRRQGETLVARIELDKLVPIVFYDESTVSILSCEDAEHNLKALRFSGDHESDFLLVSSLVAWYKTMAPKLQKFPVGLPILAAARVRLDSCWAILISSASVNKALLERLCQLMHQWRVEVLATTPSIGPFATKKARQHAAMTSIRTELGLPPPPPLTFAERVQIWKLVLLGSIVAVTGIVSLIIYRAASEQQSDTTTTSTSASAKASENALPEALMGQWFLGDGDTILMIGPTEFVTSKTGCSGSFNITKVDKLPAGRWSFAATGPQNVKGTLKLEDDGSLAIVASGGYCFSEELSGVFVKSAAKERKVKRPSSTKDSSRTSTTTSQPPRTQANPEATTKQDQQGACDATCIQSYYPCKSGCRLRSDRVDCENQCQDTYISCLSSCEK